MCSSDLGRVVSELATSVSDEDKVKINGRIVRLKKEFTVIVYHKQKGELVSKKMLLLDKPAAGMNPRETKSLMEFIRQLNAEGCTIAVIEHDMKFVMNLCNRIIVLNFGEKICEGTPYEVKADPGVQEAYFGRGIIAGTAGIPHA